MRNHCSTKGKRLLSILCIAFLVIDASAQEKIRVDKTLMYPPIGKLVDAGGHLVHMNIEGRGHPAVIFESGSGDFSFIWSLVQPAVGKFTTAISYDRAGFAWSETGPFPRTGRQLAYELHTALHNAGIKPPFILVGQSFGCFLVRNYAHFYSSEVAGVVLVDGLNEDEQININNQAIRIREMAKGLAYPPVQQFVANGKKKEYPEQRSNFDSVLETPMDKLPFNVQKLQLWAQAQPGFRIAAGNEMDWSPEDVAAIYAARNGNDYKLGNKPLFVLSKGKGNYDGLSNAVQLETNRIRLQKELSLLSSNSKYLLDLNSGHNIHLEDPGVVIDAIRQVYDAVMHHTKLK